MYGGLLKSASALAIVAAASLYGASPVKAADLGGDCCADLEERVAELEATTVRKGNRKVSVTLSGYVSHTMMWWDDGTQSDVFIGDGGNYSSRFRFTGTAKISPQMSAGFLYEWNALESVSGSWNQLNSGDDPTTNTLTLRQQVAWLKHNQLGTVKLGHGSTATDDLILIDLGGMAGASTSDVAVYGGSFLMRSTGGTLGATGTTWTAAIRGHESFDTGRRNHFLYETPNIAGFSVQAAVAEDNFWDVALRYAGEFGGIRIAAGIGYLENTELNVGTGGAGTGSVICTNLCDVKVSDLKGSASIMHVPTGLFLTGAGGRREIEGTASNTAASAYAGPDATFWYLAGGVSQNFFGIGRTVLFGEYSVHKGGLAQAQFLATGAATPLAIHDVVSKNEVNVWGVGVVQYIDAAAMDVFATYKVYSAEGSGFATGALNTQGVNDLSMFMVGTRVQF